MNQFSPAIDTILREMTAHKLGLPAECVTPELHEEIRLQEAEKRAMDHFAANQKA